MDRRKTTSRILRALGCFALVAALYGYAFRLARVQGNSMEPAFHHHQWLLVRRLNWPSPPLRRGEVIVFVQGREMLVKRIAALPGEAVPEEVWGLSRDRGNAASLLNERRERGVDTRGPLGARSHGAATDASSEHAPRVLAEPLLTADDADAARPTRVPPGFLFVLGDNRRNSDDSREFGPIPITTVLGRVIHWSRRPPPR